MKREYSWWEFLPAKIFYAPLIVYILWLCLRYRMSLARIVTADPAFERGGLSVGSKSGALFSMRSSRVYQKMVAKTVLTSRQGSHSDRFRTTLTAMKKEKVNFPVIAKPDRGHRGNGVRLIADGKSLMRLMKKTTVIHMIQPYYDFPLEFGVFYIRFPNQSAGAITGITQKILPTITGDGKRSVREIILQTPVLRARKEKLFGQNRALLDRVLSKGSVQKLLISGSHARGAIFLDASHLLTSELSRKIDTLARSADGFYFGRFDIKAKSIASFQKGKGFVIVEVNGVDSENTHIYDPKHSLFFAYRTLFAQWRTVFRIAQMVDAPHPSFLTLIKEYRILFAELESLPSVQEDI